MKKACTLAVRKKYRLLIEIKKQLIPNKYEYYNRLIRKIISTNIPVSNNITNRYLNHLNY